MACECVKINRCMFLYFLCVGVFKDEEEEKQEGWEENDEGEEWEEWESKTSAMDEGERSKCM